LAAVQPEAVQEIDTVIIAQRKPHSIPHPATGTCPAGCTLSETIGCWLQRRRELVADLAAARGSDDAEVLAGDLAAAERTIDVLIGFGIRRRGRP
jgi:hypothetical protein